MIEISISRELADEHPGFMAGCAERGHAVQVFGSDSPAAPIPHENRRCRDAPGRGHAAGVADAAIERRAARSRTD